ncbi:MAG TPA: glycosyltransferase family 1 protein [Gemmatimonadaceae bacterium]|jgi:glycosyltransferase involved in cell wall biosynthesis
MGNPALDLAGGGHASQRIAIVTDTFAPQMNGVARTLNRTAMELRSRGHDVRVFAPLDPSATDDSIIAFPSRPFWAYPQLRLSSPAKKRMIAAFNHWRPDIVHVATPFGIGLSGRAAARALALPLVSSYHTSLATYAQFYGLGALTGIGWQYLRWFHNGTSATLCPTKAIARELVEHGFSSVGLWGRGIDTRQFNPSWRSEALRTSWGASASTTVIAYVGRLAAEKGLDVVLHAMKQLAAERSDVVFVIAGDGPYEETCRRTAPQRCVFTGRIEGRQLSETYASADLFVFPSTTDTFGNVVQEAMASGLVVVGADVPQTSEVLSGAGVLATPGNSGSFAQAIRSLLEHRTQIDELRRRSLELSAARGWDAVFDGLEQKYLETITQHRLARQR